MPEQEIYDQLGIQSPEDLQKEKDVLADEEKRKADLEKKLKGEATTIATDPNKEPGKLSSIFDNLYALPSMKPDTTKNLTPEVKATMAATEKARAANLSPAKIDTADYDPFWMWMMNKKENRELKGLTMYPFPASDIRAVPTLKENLIKQNPELYKQFQAEKPKPIPVPPVQPQPVPIQPQQIPAVANEPPVHVESPATMDPNAPPVPSPTVGSQLREPEQAQAEQSLEVAASVPSAPDWLAQLGEMAKNTGKTILELLNGFAVGYTGFKTETATNQRLAREQKNEENKQILDEQKQRERMAELDRQFQFKLVQAQQDYETAMFASKNDEEKQAALEDRKFKTEEASKDRATEIERSKIAAGAKESGTKPKSLEDLARTLLGGK